ncbi:MAG: hypothetical protein AAGF24_09685, partial [Cyanobacteria bacterium P01_H01_bin.121]
MSRDALVVGLSEYAHAAALGQVNATARAIAERLELFGQFRVNDLEAADADKRVAQVGKLQGQIPATWSRSDLETALIRLFQPAPEQQDDLALFYFAGYAYVSSLSTARPELGSNGPDNPSVPQRETFLWTSDANPSAGIHGLSLNWLQRLIHASPLSQGLVLLDCYTTAATFSFGNLTVGSEPGCDRLLLATCQRIPTRSATQVSGAGQTATVQQTVQQTKAVLPQSLFAQALLEGLDPYRSELGVVTSLFLQNWVQTIFEGRAIQTCFERSGGAIAITRTAHDPCPYKGLAYFDCNGD